MDCDKTNGFTTQILQLKDDYEGEVIATLISRKSKIVSRKAIFYIHGFIDYFFQFHMADWANDIGYNFYAVDLRKHGRSILQHQKPNMTRSLSEYFEEIDKSIDIIKNKENNDFLALMGHSTGGLTSCLYLNERKNNTVDALILNSPFFEFNNPRWFKKVVLPVVAFLGKIFPKIPSPEGLDEGNALSLHRSFYGEWDFDLEYKPLSGFEINFGWISAIFNGQKKLFKGLDIKCPVLLMCSDKSAAPGRYDKSMHVADAVLNVNDIIQHADKLGKNVTSARIKNGRHDLVLSLKNVRKEVFEVMTVFLKKVEKDEI